ncbi:FtsP/CotA-like multicopper oxidase with cupredoxin domain [Lysobacter niabensis]|uniref:FtsP/CotA-like multicopper oxidase with cupredoxin domain n=1 Tax=Agrilutibacter niabensis TaxID=380628 RepID=A0ABU1VQG2_9GAMM|nr:galactose oxidase-like domain-containing protein [Lysobacter niabensis]MDR7099727.1 FtsP/CotA-like multicopper oxidase with cupredoxin domain [Lysobacter niabensis]
MEIVARGVVRIAETGLGLEGLKVQLGRGAGKRWALLCDSETAADGSFEICASGDEVQALLERRASLHVRALDAAGTELGRAGCIWRRGFLDWCPVTVPAGRCGPEDHGNGSDHPHDHGSGHSHGSHGHSDNSHGAGHDHDHGSGGAGHSHESHGHSDDSSEPGHGHDHGSAHPHDHGQHDPRSRCRRIYLRIERLQSYTPVAPDETDHMRYKIDCMHGPGHEDGTIPPNEVELRRFDAVVYRRYFDAAHTVPDTSPLVVADINEPPWDRRIPGCVLYADPGERLFIHVYNADSEPHSFHVHGLDYGIDSDGSFPFGVADHHHHRSDAICPGESWCYVFDVTQDTIGAWPFHDHFMNIDAVVSRGLFGAIIVRDPAAKKADYHVPMFLHRLQGQSDVTRFRFGPLSPGDPPVSFTFADEGTYDYFCEIHTAMTGVVRVVAGGPAAAAVSIIDSPSSFAPNDVTIGPGGTVTWTHAGNQQHTVTDRGTAAMPSWCLNGRSFVGNTPTIVARSGKRIRWYVFDLDLSTQWHNFHIHGQRFRRGDERYDTRSLGPAESFMGDTIVPNVILMPIDGCCECHEELHEGEAPAEKWRPPTRKGAVELKAKAMATAVTRAMAMTQSPKPAHGHHAEPEKPVLTHDDHCLQLRGDFLFHCHAEMHMMMGMAGLVRASQEIEASKELKACLGFELPVDDGTPCPDVEMPCMSHAGTWSTVPDLDLFVVHAAVLKTGKVLLWSGTAEAGYPTESRVWDPATDARTNQAYAADLFCSGHAWLPDGRLLVAGGAPSGLMNQTHIFDPATESWTVMANMNEARWYPTVLTLPDGRVLAASGSGASGLEIWDPGSSNWTMVAGADRTFPELFPSLHLLPAGGLFYSRCGWAAPDMSHRESARLSFAGANSGNWADLGLLQFPDRQEGMAVLRIDDTVSPPATEVFVIGGGVSGVATWRNPQTLERIDVTDPAVAAWSRGADMAFPRVNVTVVLLPNGHLLAVGGQRNGKWAADPQPVLEAEIYDPANNTWTTQAPMLHPRQYHSVAVLLPDGRVLVTGGIDPMLGTTPMRDQRSMELFSPPYLGGSGPSITSAPASATWGATMSIGTAAPGDIDSVVLLRPSALTHHTDAGLRWIKLPILGATGTAVQVRAPSSAAVAPPGPWMLFLLDAAGVPSEAKFIDLA